ncbi:Nif11-like leader peptide family natural product precursor [Bradyrhizobium sp. DOA9]|uniref:Nif11-like leader peptide family natural product precursor n=1 Tax=Bradyrhizobium sp. DOA9 TaxID=1126627 RepID=UPI000469D5E7|nr:Nif11-like leader peptide family natural product precursor [Bradyrhizobium sp. DOA9]GAJ37817.1 hypothetical protein BDOA9_0204350 [Bradyrhizobium sp. DOA9]
MSIAEVERFITDVSNDANLLEKVRASATGLASLVASANSRGYTFTLDEAKEYLRSTKILAPTNKQFDAATDATSKAVQTVKVATSVVEAVEVTTSAVQDAEVATTAAAVAEVVVVLV